MLDAANPRHAAFDTHAETAMRRSAVLAQIDIPLEGFNGKLLLLNAPQQQLGIVNALAAADNFAVALRRENIDRERHLRPFEIRLKVERLDVAGEAVDHQGTIVI